MGTLGLGLLAGFATGGYGGEGLRCSAYQTRNGEF